MAEQILDEKTIEGLRPKTHQEMSYEELIAEEKSIIRDIAKIQTDLNTPPLAGKDETFPAVRSLLMQQEGCIRLLKSVRAESDKKLGGFATEPHS